jgi:glycosyltransferase involved in cell wall biosynthesis
MSKRNNIISIVTPSYNQGQFIAETIESVIFQKGDFYIDYIIMDGGSTDNTIDIIKFYENYLKEKCITKVIGDKEYFVSKKDFNEHAAQDDIWIKNLLSVSCRGVSFTWESKKDKGQYDAISQGFDKASGSIFAYINSDDMYLPNAFAIAVRVFHANPFVHWIKGLNSYFNEIGGITFERIIFSNYILRKGYYDGLYGLPCLQQESTMWTRDLYERAGGISTKYQYASDYALWVTFSQYEKLYLVPYALAGFRFQRNQKTRDMTLYNKEVDMLTKRNTILRIFYTVLHKARNSLIIIHLLRPLKKLIVKGEKITFPSTSLS